jgi:hypothetical protein
MTIAAGFCCSDGVILAADTLITLPGGGKTYRSKLFTINEGESSDLTYAGDEPFVLELINKLQQNVPRRSGDAFLKAVKGIYRQLWREHYIEPPKAEKTYAHILITLRMNNSICLYCAYAHHFYPVNTYAVLGIGEDRGESLFKPLYRVGMETYEASYMAVYAFQKVKKYTEGCGGETEVRFISPRNQHVSLTRFANFAVLPERTSREIEEDFDVFDKAMQPVLLVYPDLDSTNPKQFRKLFCQAMKKLEKTRIAKYRKREKEDRKREVSIWGSRVLS